MFVVLVKDYYYYFCTSVYSCNFFSSNAFAAAAAAADAKSSPYFCSHVMRPSNHLSSAFSAQIVVKKEEKSRFASKLYKNRRKHFFFIFRSFCHRNQN
jgi:hypothetical protein